MNFDQFQALPENRQFLTVYSNGVFISERSNDDCTVHLYQIGDFYVEVFNQKENGNILLIKAFREMDKLDPYLQRIDIGELIY